MPRERSPSREKAREMYLNSKGEMKLKDIAAELGVLDTQIRKWKSTDKWDNELKGTLPKEKRNVTNKNKVPQNEQHQRTRSGNHNPENQFTKRNKGAQTHGFFSKYLPEESLEIMLEIEKKSLLDMLWDNIMIQYTAIIRAQKIMFVTDKDEMIKELKKEKRKSSSKETEKRSSNNEEVELEYEFQFAWDRQASFLQAQSRAISELRSSIKQYYEIEKETKGGKGQEVEDWAKAVQDIAERRRKRMEAVSNE